MNPTPATRPTRSALLTYGGFAIGRSVSGAFEPSLYGSRLFAAAARGDGSLEGGQALLEKDGRQGIKYQLASDGLQVNAENVRRFLAGRVAQALRDERELSGQSLLPVDDLVREASVLVLGSGNGMVAFTDVASALERFDGDSFEQNVSDSDARVVSSALRGSIGPLHDEILAHSVDLEPFERGDAMFILSCLMDGASVESVLAQVEDQAAVRTYLIARLR